MTTQKTIWVKVPFTLRCYEVSNTGFVRSFNANGQSGYRLLKGKQISSTNKRLLVDVIIENIDQRKSILISRLVFFCHYYVPKILKKTLSNATWQEFQKMPLVVHKNGDVLWNNVANLEAKLSHKEVAIWSNKEFPRKFIIPTRTSCIKGEDAELCTTLLRQGVSYPKIAKLLSIDVHPMVVQRFNKFHKIDMNRPSSKPKLTDEQQKQIPLLLQTLNQKQIAEKFGVSESCISRFVRKKRYKERAV